MTRKSLLDRSAAFLHAPIGAGPRSVLVLAACLVVAAHFLALWNLTMFAPQYPHGLRLDIYDNALVGGNRGQDIKEINVLNHYIGMKDLSTADFTEFQWMPFVLGALALLFLRAAILGRMATLVDMLVVFFYFGAFSLWSFAYKLYRYGHDLDPTAAVKVAPFMPPLFGHRKLANFEVYSYPAAGSYALLGVAIALAAAMFFAWREGRAELVGETRMAAG